MKNNRTATIRNIAIAVLTGAIATTALVQADAKTRTEVFDFTLESHAPHPITVKEFVPVLAGQLERYNAVAPELWPGNTLVNQQLVVEDIDTNKIWHIAPNGDTEVITAQQAEKLGIERSDRANDFGFFKGGTYVTINKDYITDKSNWEKYYHLGTIDTIIWATHEGFHAHQGAIWESPEENSNADRDERFEDFAARATRKQLHRQLLTALAEPGNEKRILEALATYEYWKANFPEDYATSIMYDRIEGGAFYYEIVSSLYISYGDQINNAKDLEQAVAQLAKAHGEDYVNGTLGLTNEGYNIGGFAGLLLDRVDPNWKEAIEADPVATPIEMLRQHYQNAKLPKAQRPSEQDVAAIEDQVLAMYREELAGKDEKLAEMEALMNGWPEEFKEMFRAEMLERFDHIEQVIAAQSK